MDLIDIHQFDTEHSQVVVSDSEEGEGEDEGGVEGEGDGELTDAVEVSTSLGLLRSDVEKNRTFLGIATPPDESPLLLSDLRTKYPQVCWK